MAGFASLMLGKHQGIQSLGLVMTIGVATCMLGALTVVPAMLAMTASPTRGKKRTQ
jgi:predicted RND superfamily exporter protein